MKQYKYQVYNRVGSTGAYLTTWEDVSSDIQFNQEINTAGSQIVVTLPRNAGDYGEGTDIDFGYNVRIYCYDKEDVDGVLIFQGFISAYTPIYGANKVEVTLLSYGEELNRFMLQEGLILDANGDTQMNTSGHGVSAWVKDISGITYVLWDFVVAAGCTGIQSIDIGYFPGDLTKLRTWTLYRGTVALGSVTYSSDANWFTWYDSFVSSDMPFEKVTFSPHIDVTPGETLTIRLDIPTAVDF